MPYINGQHEGVHSYPMKKNLLVDHMFGTTEDIAIHSLTQKQNALRQLVLQDEY